MPAFEPTKGLFVVACDETGEVIVMPMKVLHIATAQDFASAKAGQGTISVTKDGDYAEASYTPPSTGG